MRLKWIAADGAEIPIETPSKASPDPGYMYLTSRGFGGSESEISLQHGAYQDGGALTSVYLSPRHMSIEFAILADSANSVQFRRRTVAAAFNPHAGPGILVWEQECGKRYAIRCIATTATPSFPQGDQCGKTWQTVIVDLLAPDPCWYDYDAEPLHLAGLTGGVEFPVSFPTSFGVQGTTVTVENEGDIAAPVQMSISGPVENPVVRNLTTGKHLALDLDIRTREKVEIDTEYGRMYCRLIAPDGVQTNAIRYLSEDSEFWTVEPGANVLTYTATSGSAEVVVRFASRHSGI